MPNIGKIYGNLFHIGQDNVRFPVARWRACRWRGRTRWRKWSFADCSRPFDVLWGFTHSSCHPRGDENVLHCFQFQDGFDGHSRSKGNRHMQSDDVGEKQVYPLLAIPEQNTEGRSSSCVWLQSTKPQNTSGRGQWGYQSLSKSFWKAFGYLLSWQLTGFPMEIDALLDIDSAS